MTKHSAIPPDEMVEIVPHAGGCLATKRITVDGLPVGYMYREDTDVAEDTGWRFFAGDESQEYIDDLTNTGVYSLNTLANCDLAIVPYLETPAPCAFERVEGDVTFRPTGD